MKNDVFRLLDTDKPFVVRIKNELFRINIPKGSDCLKLFTLILNQLKIKNPHLEVLSTFLTIDKYTYEVQLSKVNNLVVYLPNKKFLTKKT